MKDTLDRHLTEITTDCDKYREYQDSNFLSQSFPKPLSTTEALAASAQEVTCDFEDCTLTTTVELDLAVLKTLHTLCELLDARCQLKNNPNDGLALSLVPPSISVALLLPNACQITPSVHTSGPANADPLFIKILSDVMVSTFCDSRIFARSAESDLHSSYIQDQMHLTNHYPISFTDFESIRTKHNNTNKPKNRDTTNEIDDNIEIDDNENDSISNDDDDDED